MTDESRRAELIRRIKSIAREEIAERGAAGLSLSRIARRIGMTTPALYRYFAGRDELVTALVVDAYSELCDVTEQALAAVDSHDLLARYDAFMSAYRRWALAHPQDYILIHGAVFPGYRAPVERVAAAVLRVLKLFVDLLRDADRLGRLRIPPDFARLPEELASALRLVDLPGPLLTVAFLTWLQLHALVWQEIAGHLPSVLFADGSLFRLHTRNLARQLGMLPDEGA
jgi:AcrR family transcriptional regulator